MDVRQAKLRPIYDALDSQDFKGVIRLCDRKDCATMASAQALKCIALSKLKRESQAMDVIKVVLQTDELDDTTISNIELALRELGMFQQINDMFAKTCGNRETHKEMWEFYYASCIRVGQFSTMQAIALGMVKRARDPKYVSWAGICMMAESERLVASESPDLKAAAQKIKMCSNVMQKALAYIKTAEKEPGIALTSVCFLLIESIVAQVAQDPSQIDLAIQVAQENLSHLQPREQKLVIAEIYCIGKKWNQASDLFYELIKNEDSEDWRNLAGFVECSLLCNTESDNKIDVASKLEAIRGETKTRGPLLALVYYSYLKFVREGGEATDFVNKLATYVETFDSKSCCFGDVVNFLSSFIALNVGTETLSRIPPRCNPVYLRKPFGVPLHKQYIIEKQAKRWPVDLYGGALSMNEQAKKEFESKILTRLRVVESQMDQGSVDPEAMKNSVRSILTCYQVLRYIGYFDSANQDTIIGIVMKLLQTYKITLSVEQSTDDNDTRSQKESRICDGFMLLAAHFLMDLSFHDAIPYDRLIEAVAILEQARRNSPYGFQISLMLLELYGKVNVNTRACELYTALSIKHIQLDSLSHLILGDCIRSGFYTEALQVCTNLETLWLNSRRENPDYFRRALVKDNLSSAREFLQLDYMLLFSHQRTVTISEAFYLHLMVHCLEDWQACCTHIISQMSGATHMRTTRMHDILTLNLEGLSRNNDFSTRLSWDSPNGVYSQQGLRRLTHAASTETQFRGAVSNAHYQEQWFTRSTHWIRLRITVAKLLWILVASDDMPSSESLEGNLEAQIEILGLLQSPGLGLLWASMLELAHVANAISIGDASNVQSSTRAFATKLQEAVEGIQALTEPVEWQSWLYDPILSLVIGIRALMVKYPKKRKQKTLDAMQESVRAASVAMTSLLQLASSAIESSFTNLVKAKISPEVAEYLDESLISYIDMMKSDYINKSGADQNHTVTRLVDVIKQGKY